MERILELAMKKAEAAEVIYGEVESRSASFEDNELESLSTKGLRGAGLRVIRNGRIGFSSTTDLNRWENLVDCALHAAEFGEEARFSFPATCERGEVKLHDKKTASTSHEKMVEIGKRAIESVLAKRPEAQCGADVSCSSARRRLINSSGLNVEYECSDASMGIHALIVRDSGLLGIGEGESSALLAGDLQKHAEEVLRKLDLSEKEARVAACKLPVIFPPKAGDVLLATLDANTNGKLLQKGVSILKGRLGENVLDERITITNDPSVDYAAGSNWVDGEGMPCRAFPLFEEGVFKNFLYDLQTAGLMQAEPTGSGFRSFASTPGPGHANTVVAAGDVSFEEMVRGMKRGIVVDQLLGAGQSNVLAGEFSVNVELGFLVENGEIVARVKDCMVSGNAFDALNRVRALGSEVEWHGDLAVPAICIDELSISGTA